MIDRIRFIRAGQSVGLTLRQLDRVLQIRDAGESPCRHVTGMLDERIDDVDRRIEELGRLRQDLTTMRRDASSFDPADCPPESVCRIVRQTS